MEKNPLYILTYDHGGYVLWADRVKPRLKDIREWMEKYPRLRIGLDYESFTFDEFMREDPEVVTMVGELLRDFPDRIGLGATTYGQPLSLYISEESNVRQLSLAVKTNLHYFGVTPDVYCISEFALNNQSPQMLKKSGYKAAILRSHVMGYGYTKTFDVPWGTWVGKDGTGIPSVPVYHGQGRGYNCTTLDNWILSRWPDDTDISLEDFRETFKDYSPLLASRYDDLTQPIEKVTAEIEKHEDYKYVLLEDIPELYGEPKEILDTTDNDFHSQMPWGYCGNEIFNGIRKGETDCVQAEKLNALSVMLGGEDLQAETEEAWKYILAAQHHDVTICGLLDLARRFIPSSYKFSERVMEKSLQNIGKHFAHKAEKSLFVMNPHSFPVRALVKTECDGSNMLEAEICLPPLTAKSIALSEINKENAPSAFAVSENVLETPLYKLSLDKNGIKGILNKKTGKEIFAHEKGQLLSGYINGKDRVFEGTYEIKTHGTIAEIIFTGSTGDISCVFTVTLYKSLPRIDCRLSCEVKENDRIGRTDITEGRPVPLTLNGHHHHDKLCFTFRLNCNKDRKMFRDLPFSIAEWDGQLRLTEEYWYPNDRILIDTPVSAEESFNGITHLQGVNWIALRDEEKGLSVMNRGCMGSAVQGNKVYIPLIYSNDYMCGTKILDGTFVNEFSLLPLDADISNTLVHKAAMEYNMPVISRILEKGEGDTECLQFASLESDNDGVILTALYPENGKLVARACNFSDTEAEVTLGINGKGVRSEEDFLGNVISEIHDGRISVKPWEIRTLSSTIN